MSAKRSVFALRVRAQLAAVEAELAQPGVPLGRRAELRRQRQILLVCCPADPPILVRREPEGCRLRHFGPRRPSPWRRIASAAARTATMLGILAISAFLWLVIAGWGLWAVRALGIVP